MSKRRRSGNSSHDRGATLIAELAILAVDAASWLARTAAAAATRTARAIDRHRHRERRSSGSCR